MGECSSIHTITHIEEIKTVDSKVVEEEILRNGFETIIT